MICNKISCLSFNLDFHQMQNNIPYKSVLCVYGCKEISWRNKMQCHMKKELNERYGQRSLTQNNIVSESLSFKNVSAAGLKETN